MNFLYVGLGGGVGAILRYAISLIPCKGRFPVLTLVTNFLGAVLIGFVVQMAEKKGLSPAKLLFLKTGLCGGFTTFSTFSLEAYQLLQGSFYGYAVGYIVLSVIVCLAGIRLGMSLL